MVIVDDPGTRKLMKEYSNATLLYHKIFTCGNCPSKKCRRNDDAVVWACHTKYGEDGPMEVEGAPELLE